MKHLTVTSATTAKALDTAIGKEPVLVAYVANWCPYCQTFMGEGWQDIVASNQVTTALVEQKHFSVLNKGKVKHSWTTFPTLVLYHKGIRHQFDPETQRTLANIKKFCDKIMKGPHVGGAKATRRKASQSKRKSKTKRKASRKRRSSPLRRRKSKK